ncbi:MAG: malto-oligosyltrehalose trehalohydrolase [Gemmatimonadota bacterium]
MSQLAELPLGARPLPGGGASFRVWAPHAERVEVVLLSDDARHVPLAPLPRGYHAAVVDGVAEGTRYRFRLDGGEPLPDPASRWQPEGVHGPSAVVGVAFNWTDDSWRAPPLRDWVLYELHVGSFTPEGTFDAVIPHLPALAELGVRALELMPVAAFPGTRNWGYDGAHPFAVQESYGGPRGLKRLVDAAHRHGLAVVLDVVYNHLGPEGNYLAPYGPYFTRVYHTPWGSALNFDERGSDQVRGYFVENACQWVGEYHIDGLRVDAVHAILDRSARPFLRELAARARARAAADGRPAVIIAESDLGDPRVLYGPERGGLGMDGQWLDDFHHALHALLTGEARGYYADFGALAQLGKAFRRGYVYTGQYSRYRDRSHGAAPNGVPPRAFVVYAQNHDQVGNRPAGDRLAATLDHAKLRLAAATVLLSPFTPLLFMGEEYGETNPFPYFVSHTDPALVEAVRRGRKEEFAGFHDGQEVPDPQAESTFRSAVPDRDRASQPAHAALLALHRALLQLRREVPALRPASMEDIHVDVDEARGVLRVRTAGAGGSALLILHFGDGNERVALPDAAGGWRVLVDTGAARWRPDADFERPEPDPREPVETIELAPWSAVALLHEEQEA